MFIRYICSTTMGDFRQKFYDITDLIQTEFDRNLELYGDKIQCRKGCSKCCSQIFRITLLDAWMISRHIKSLPIEQNEQLQQKAKQYKQGDSCPALGNEGECTIYEARPVICRRFGMPIYDYKNPQSVHACELNFKDGDEITDVQLVPNQTEIGIRWDELKAEFGEGSTTIAEAIMKS
jgi:Fe-S-cluster containining protein